MKCNICIGASVSPIFKDEGNAMDEEDPGIETGTSTPSRQAKQSQPFHDHDRRTAYYNHASEKSISHAEAKMIYRRHVLESGRHNDEQKLPPSAIKVPSSYIDGEVDSRREVSRTPSRRQTKTQGPGQPNMSAQHLDSGIHLPSRHFHGPYALSVDGSDVDHSEICTGCRLNASPEVLPQLSSNFGSDISPELSEISINIHKVLKLRHKYIKLSLQGPHDNPRDWDSWQIYPPPPNPTWDENKNRPMTATKSLSSPMSNNTLPEQKPSNSLQNSCSSTVDDAAQQQPQSATTKSRKMGLNVGEDFDLEDLQPFPGIDTDVSFKLDEGSVYQIYEKSEHRPTAPLVDVPKLRDYYIAMDEIQGVSSDGPTKSFAYRQLDILEGKFQLYFLVNSYQETADCKKVPHRDFYNVRKVDTHVHHSACMNQKHLLRFIKSKMKKFPHEVVMFRDGKELSLEQVFDSINLTAYDLSIDTLDMHAHTDSFHRFDKFNLKYNPIGESRLREIFLKTDNFIQGRYLAELTKEVISDLEASKYQFVEWRVSIYGRSIHEWDKLAAWVIDNKLISHNVRWLVQIPRLYSTYKATSQMESFESIVINIFQPLYQVTRDPSSNPKLHTFLQRVIGFDSVDDESKIETRLYRKFPPPKEWNTKQNPPYTYWIYFLFANMTSLNVWRQRRGFNTFVLRPHCGEAGDIDHLASAVLCCHSISHGLMLRKVPLLQYIFYLDQIGIAMSPLSNNALFLSYDRNPFPKYFKRGLNVSLSTDDPLQFAFTKEPLIEEYSVAAQIYRLSAVDMCELAHHSVVQSGFERELKKRWLGDYYHLSGVEGNRVAKSNVPDIRERFRFDTLREEIAMLERYASAAATPAAIATPISTLAPSSAPSFNKTSNTGIHVGRGPASHSNAAIGILDPQNDAQDSSSLAQSSSLFMSPINMHSTYISSHSPTLSQPRIFPGIVHERHRRGSIRQSSGSETDGDMMFGSGYLSERMRPTSDNMLEEALKETVLEDGAEDT
ncbi:MAG: hypothetical protein Q9217_002591 [Psora testacea]